MAIKISIGKLTLSQPFEDVINQIKIQDFEVLPILPQHTLRVSVLPFHHRDPFDRIIIAQALTENIAIISNDGEFSNYDVRVV